MVVQDLVWRACAACDHDARAPVAPRGQVHGHPGILEQRRELPGTIGSFYTALLGTESAKRKPRLRQFAIAPLRTGRISCLAHD